MRSKGWHPSLSKLRQWKFGSRLRNSRGLRGCRHTHGEAVCEGIRRRQDDLVIRVEAVNDLDIRAVIAAEFYGLQYDVVLCIHRADAQAIAAEQQYVRR